MKEEQKGEIILYQSDIGKTKIEVRLSNDTVWLTQKMMAELFQTTTQNITIHLKNIFEEFELQEDTTCKDFLQVQNEGSRMIERKQKFYNLDAIISVGYRVKSHVATKFRIWATERLREYIQKGFTMDDERLKQAGGGSYWKELLERIRDIRSSEKVFYRQILDIYATSIDYEPKADESAAFFKKVQNKIHYAVHGQTAAELIYSRVDAEKEFMGLMTFSGDKPHLADAIIAKNYLKEKELRALNQIVSGYLDFAERQAEREISMTMKDWAQHLDGILTATGEQILQNAGSISHEQALDKAKAEYKKFQAKTLSSAEHDYLENIKAVQKKIEKKGSEL